MRITNKKARRDYTILETYEAGINLLGAEVKSVRAGHIKLAGAFVRIIGSEAYLVNSEIPLYPYARPDGYDAKRTRKLLLHKRQILTLKHRSEQKRVTVVPIAVYTAGNHIKVEIALARGTREYEKREKIRRRDLDRDMERQLRRR